LVAIRRYLQSEGDYCAVVNLTRYRRPDSDDVYYPRNPFQVVGLLLRLNYDIIHIHFGGNVTLRLLVLWLVCSLIPGKKTVLTFHSGGYPSSKEGQSARRGTLRGFIFRRLDRIISVNEEMVAMFRRFGVSPSRIRLISPHSFLQPPPTDVRPEIANFFQSHSPVLATVGGLEVEYDIPLQIEVIGDLLPKFPRLGLVIIGGGSLEREIRDLIQSHPHSGHLLLCGDVDHAETLCVIQDCRVLLRTTLYDGDSIAVREALHVGTPVVATDNGMRPPGVHLFPISDRDGCRRIIEQVLDEPPRQESPGQTDSGNILAVVQLYRELLA
jgi:glycosyltransferase involved in cell wall biosynthesis